MNRTDLHVHTLFSDGKNTPEEMIQTALAGGLKTIGISEHSYMPFAQDWCMRREEEPSYLAQITALKEKYRGQIEVLCGIELDFDSVMDTSAYDYVIGSVHFLRFGNDYVSVDDRPEVLHNAAARYCGGDMYALAERYYQSLGRLIEKAKINIVGHFDLITKFCEKVELFDNSHPRYRAAWKEAADKLLKANVLFEINTGAITRGYRTTPYPSSEIQQYLKLHGAKFVMSSDSHSIQAMQQSFLLPIWQNF